MLFRFLATVVSVFIKRIMHNMNCATGTCSQEIIYMVLVRDASGLLRNFLDTINVINVKLCMMVLHIELYLFITLSVTLTSPEGHSSVK